uniref:DUF2439 domain-containing protein n=1 Tax=Graphocephala atropunctata TaxID=36148 RepID=A0A1B6KPC8_9HEMI
MRRSSAPSKSGRSFCPPGFLSSTNEKKTTPAAPSAPFENAARSTKSILSLIAKVKQTSEDTSADSNVSLLSNEGDKPLNSPAVLSENLHNQEKPVSDKRIFNVVYGKPSKKKHKTWEGDGILEVGEKSLTLKDGEGVVLGRGSGKKNSGSWREVLNT